MDFMPWPGRGWSGGEFLAFDVSVSASPRIVSEINLKDNNWYSFSQPYTVGTAVYVSHSVSEELIEKERTNWVERYYLDVIDYADPTDPAVRKPVNIPGALKGVSHNGELLYTVGAHWTSIDTSWREWLDATAYDGVSANLVASMLLPETWPHPVLVVGTNVLVGTAKYESATNAPAHQLETYAVILNGTGEFARTGSQELESPASYLWHKEGLLAVQDSNSEVLLFDARDTTLAPLGKGKPAGCYWWFDLSGADGDVARGLWLPLGGYGIGRVPIQ
jgi:hypothetical protein